jgi:hypothetical protein
MYPNYQPNYQRYRDGDKGSMVGVWKDYIRTDKVRNLLFPLVHHIGDLASKFTTDERDGTDLVVESIYCDLHRLCDEMQINLVDSVYLRHYQLEIKYPIGPRNPVPPRWTHDMLPGRQWVSQSHLKSVDVPMRRHMTIPNDPKLFDLAKPILEHMTLNWADDRGYYDYKNARSLALLAVSECSQLCEIFQYYKDDPNLRIPRKQTQYMAEEEIGDIVLTLLRFTFTEKKEAEDRKKIKGNV